jgi:phosphotransferase system, enzyme I, PtsP
VPDAYLRERLHDLDDLSNRLLRILTGQGKDTGARCRKTRSLLRATSARAELLEYGRKLKGVVLEEGSVGSHAAIVARALAIPLVIHAGRIVIRGAERRCNSGGWRSGNGASAARRSNRTRSFRDKIAMQAKAQERFISLRDLPATTKDGVNIGLYMNAGLMADLPSLVGSGAEGVGLFRTELQFLIRSQMPRREELAALYSKVMESSRGLPVYFRTLDIGSDKVLPYMKPQDEPNPAMGWRAIRVGLDKPGVLRMQLQALIRAAAGRPLTVMFPFVAEFSEFKEARSHLFREIHRETSLGHPVPEKVEVGAMLEMPSLAYAPDAFFEMVDFISIGGNDLKQFFFAADRENERVRKRYDVLNTSFLTFLQFIVARCAASGTRLSFCGEDAGRPLEAMVFAAMGLRNLSMRPASIGPVKEALRAIDLAALRRVIDEARAKGAETVRPVLEDWLPAR